MAFPGKYRYCLMDLDRTLWDFQANAWSCLTALCDRYRLCPPFKDAVDFYSCYEKHNRELWDLYDARRISQAELRRRRFTDTLADCGIDDPALGSALDADYLEMLPTRKQLMPHALEVVQTLHTRGIPIALVTNGFLKVQQEKIASSGIAPYIDKVIISEIVGRNKPHPRIFLQALMDLNARKKETLMVGDDFAKDIEGARAAGIDQFYYWQGKPDPGPTGATHQGDDLRQLLKLFR